MIMHSKNAAMARFLLPKNQQGRIPKHKRSMLSKEKSDSSSTREMVVVSKESLLEMEEKLRILSASK